MWEYRGYKNPPPLSAQRRRFTTDNWIVPNNVTIPEDRIELSFVKSSGPGGQSVNKSNSKVELLFCLDEAHYWLPKEVCEPKVAPAPVAAPKPSGEKITIAADALFDFDKATLRPEGKAKLDELVAKSKAIKLEVILVVGHTDRIGSDSYNQKLSERRAAAVKSYLVSKGIEANRVYTEGKGEKQPVTGDKCKGNKATKELKACLQPDRRADIEIIGTK